MQPDLSTFTRALENCLRDVDIPKTKVNDVANGNKSGLVRVGTLPRDGDALHPGIVILNMCHLNRNAQCLHDLFLATPRKSFNRRERQDFRRARRLGFPIGIATKNAKMHKKFWATDLHGACGRNSMNLQEEAEVAERSEGTLIITK